MYELEYHLEKFYEQMGLNELSLICLLFFKQSNKQKILHSNILWCCVTASINIEEMQSYNVSSIMKFCRSFRNKDEVDIFKELLLALEPRLDRYNWIVLSNVAQAAANHSLYIESAINQIINRYAQSVPITGMFLEQMGYYNLSLLEKVMDPKFYTPLYTNMLYNQNLEYLWLDQSIEIEIPDFKGCRLDDKIVKRCIKKYKDLIPNLQSKSLNKYNKMALDVFVECQNCFGDSSVAFTHVLPHYMKPDLVIAMNSFNKTLPGKEIPS